MFENQQDLSPKLCSVKYGTCDNEMYSAQNHTTDGSLSTVTLKLNSSIINPTDCFVVTARNDTFTVMMEGNFETQQSNNNLSVIVGLVIGALLLLLVLALATCTVIVVIAMVLVTQKSNGIVILINYINYTNTSFMPIANKDQTDPQTESLELIEKDLVVVVGISVMSTIKIIIVRNLATVLIS